MEVLEHVLNGIGGELRHILYIQAWLKPELHPLQIRAAKCRSKYLHSSAISEQMSGAVRSSKCTVRLDLKAASRSCWTRHADDIGLWSCNLQ